MNDKGKDKDDHDSEATKQLVNDLLSGVIKFADISICVFAPDS